MQNTKLIKKISTSLVSTGEIIDSLQSNSSTNAPSIRAVVDNMTPPMNLLINGDFKINQRGQSSYTESLKYTVDMWRMYLAKVDVLSNGVRVTSTNSSQKGFFTQLIDRVNGEHTISLKANSKVYSFTFTPSNQQQRFRGDVFNVFVWNQDEKQTTEISIEIDIGNSVEIEYINLFEGDIAYPHVEEDDAIALMRCQKFFIRKGISTVLYYKYGSGEELRLGGEIPSMESVPTVNITGCFSFDNASAANTIRSVTSVYVSDTFYLDARVVFAKPMHPSCYGVILICEISCEPR